MERKSVSKLFTGTVCRSLMVWPSVSEHTSQEPLNPYLIIFYFFDIQAAFSL